MHYIFMALDVVVSLLNVCQLKKNNIKLLNIYMTSMENNTLNARAGRRDILTTIYFQIRTSLVGHTHYDYEIPKIVLSFFWWIFSFQSLEAHKDYSAFIE